MQRRGAVFGATLNQRASRPRWPGKFESCSVRCGHEAFSQRNINFAGLPSSIERFAPVVQAALRGRHCRLRRHELHRGLPLRGRSPEKVGLSAGLMKNIGVAACGRSRDTIGVGTPVQVQKALEATLARFDIDQVSGHFHDTYGRAPSNTLAALDLGGLESQSSGRRPWRLSLMPRAPRAIMATGRGPICCRAWGIETGIDLDKLIDAGQFISEHLAARSRAWPRQSC